MNREVLPNRRRCETFDFDWEGFKRNYAVTVGYYPDGRPGELFITGAKSGEQIEAIVRDGAVSISIALQYGAKITTLAGAITRDAHDNPQTLIGAILDKLAGESSLHVARPARPPGEPQITGGPP